MLVDFPLRLLLMETASIWSEQIIPDGELLNDPTQNEQRDRTAYLTPPCWSFSPTQEMPPRRRAFRNEEHSRSSVFSGKC